MRTLGKVMIAVVLVVVAGCDDDDDDDIIGPNGEVTVFQVDLTTSQEVMPCGAAGLNASGSATVAISADEDFIQVTALTFNNLSGAPTAASINAGRLGVEGPVVFPLNVTLTPFSTVAFDASDYPSPVPAGAAVDFPSFIDTMRAGNTYLTVETAACPTGELRGQIQ